MIHSSLRMDMIIIGLTIGIGRDRGDAEKDKEGMLPAESLGKRMAWVLKRIYG